MSTNCACGRGYDSTEGHWTCDKCGEYGAAWNDFAEVLPEKGQRVLVANATGDYALVKYIPIEELPDPTIKVGFTHWRPLPEPPPKKLLLDLYGDGFDCVVLSYHDGYDHHVRSGKFRGIGDNEAAALDDLREQVAQALVD